MTLIKKFITSTFLDKFLFLAAIGISLLVKIAVLTMPLRWYSRFLGQIRQTISEGKNNDQKIIQSITRAVNRCSRYAPWRTKCLVDAITAKLMLRCYGIPSTLFLGVNKDEGKQLIAHAWLKCGDTFITGKKGYQKFTVVSSFA